MSCCVCGDPDAPHSAPSLLTPEQQAEVAAYHASFRDGDGNPVYHTGHLRPDLLELPRRLCAAHRRWSSDAIRASLG